MLKNLNKMQNHTCSKNKQTKDTFKIIINIKNKIKMKKLRILLLTVIGITIIFSCNKKEEIISKKNNFNNLQKDMQQLRVYYDNGGEDYGCEGSGGNCLPDIIVRPTSVLNELLNQIQEIRNIYQQDVEFANSLISDIVADNESTFQDIFPQSVIDEIVSEELQMYIRGTESYRCI
jgi:hypothetical protein